MQNATKPPTPDIHLSQPPSGHSVSEPQVQTQPATDPKLPLGIIATTPFGDTDFRRKLGIARWGWGLND